LAVKCKQITAVYKGGCLQLQRDVKHKKKNGLNQKSLRCNKNLAVISSDKLYLERMKSWDA